jgi:GxxExxY protein
MNETTVSHQLSGKIIGCAMKVHGELGFGFVESVYENSLAHELRKADLAVQQQVPMKVYYDGIVVGEFLADMIVDGELVLELKAVQTFSPLHEVQLVNYLNATRKESGLLFNFGAKSLQFKRKFRHPKQGSGSTGFTGITGLLIVFFSKLMGWF